MQKRRSNGKREREESLERGRGGGINDPDSEERRRMRKTPDKFERESKRVLGLVRNLQI